MTNNLITNNLPTVMTKDQIKNYVNEEITSAVWEEKDFAVVVDKNDLKALCQLLLYGGYEFLADATAVDYIKEEKFRLIYQIGNFVDGTLLTVKVDIDRENPEIISLCEFWDAANWLEREIYDFFGIKFTGHPNLIRILLTDDFEGYPLKKDYVHVPSKYQGRRSMN